MRNNELEIFCSWIYFVVFWILFSYIKLQRNIDMYGVSKDNGYRQIVRVRVRRLKKLSFSTLFTQFYLYGMKICRLRRMRQTLERSKQGIKSIMWEPTWNVLLKDWWLLGVLSQAIAFNFSYTEKQKELENWQVTCF